MTTVVMRIERQLSFVSVAHVFWFALPGVSEVETDVAAKKVTVSSDGATTKQAMLDALLKWSAASGKTVELASD